jgi:hypothetical protein
MKLSLRCTECEQEFQRDAAEFKRSNKGKGRQYCSQACQIAYANKHLRKWPKGAPDRLHAANRRDGFTPFRWFLARCRNRKHENGMTLEYLREVWEEQQGVCPYTGFKLILPDSTAGWKDGPNIRNASLDRKDSSKGYIEGNVQFIATPLNPAKGALSLSDFEDLLRAVARRWHE